MRASKRPYDPATDFLSIRRFLIDTFRLYGRPFNWLLDRWNFTRHFVAPVHSFYNVRYFGVPTLIHKSVRDEVRAWEETIWVWETEDGQIAGVVHSENEEPGEAVVQIHPDHTYLYGEMVDHAEEHLADRVDGVAYIKIYAHNGTELESLVAGRGYRKLGQNVILEYEITGDEKPGTLPDGFAIMSVAQEDDVDQRRIAKAVAFGGYYAPSSWPPAWTMREMQKAPDYRPDLDLFIKAPNGDCAAFCTVWADVENRYANFEPVGTRADYQRLGLGSALQSEGFRRMASMGVTRSFMVSTNPFYRHVGFRETPYTFSAWMKYLDR